MTNKVKRGDLYLADLSFAVGSEQTGVRPVLIIQNNKGNKYSPTTIIVCLSSKIHSKAKIPTHYLLPELNGLKYPSMVLCEQIKVIDKDRLIKKIGKINKRDMHYIDSKIRISLELKDEKRKHRCTKLNFAQ